MLYSYERKPIEDLKDITLPSGVTYQVYIGVYGAKSKCIAFEKETRWDPAAYEFENTYESYDYSWIGKENIENPELSDSDSEWLKDYCESWAQDLVDEYDFVYDND